MCLLNADFHILRANDALKKIFCSTGNIEDTLFCSAVKCRHFVPPNKMCSETEPYSECVLYDIVKSAFGGGKTISRINVPWVCTEAGKPTEKYLQVTCIPLTFISLTYVLLVIHDISALKEKEQQVKDSLDHDYLTGLADRRFFYDVFESYFLTAKRGFINIAACMIDIDALKNINRTYGHKAGDFIIQEVTSVMKNCLRKSDFIARYGGDKFCIIFQYKNTSDVLSAAEKIRSRIETHDFRYKEKRLHATVSAGVVLYPGHSTDAVIEKVESLLCSAKAKGGNRVEIDA